MTHNNQEKIEAGAKDFDKRFTGVMKELAEEENNWEKRFDEEFGHSFREDEYDIVKNAVKFFISAELARARKEGQEEILHILLGVAAENGICKITKMD